MPLKALLAVAWMGFMSRLSDEDRKAFELLVKPSWLSGLIAVIVGLVISIGVIVAFEAHNSTLQQQLMGWQQTRPQPTLTTPGQTVVENDHPTLKGSWSLLLVWSLVGLLVYGLVATIVHSIGQAEGLRESLHYVNARPHTMLTSTAEHVLLRVIAAITLVVFAMAFWRQVIPYSIQASDASAADVISFYGLLYAVLSFALIALSLHAQTILLRLTMGRARLFSRL